MSSPKSDIREALPINHSIFDEQEHQPIIQVVLRGTHLTTLVLSPMPMISFIFVRGG